MELGSFLSLLEDLPECDHAINSFYGVVPDRWP